jgi:hypothetical protein
MHFPNVGRALLLALLLTHPLCALTVINSPPTVIGNDQEINADTRLNVLSGGSVGNSFDANSGSEVVISGGTVGNNFQANNGSQVTISGGNVGDSYRTGLGAVTTLSGGVVGDLFQANSGASAVDILGGEFRLDGNLIAGLGSVGMSQIVVLPSGSLLSGTLSDGTPFAFSTRDGDSFATTTLTLHVTSLPAIGPTTINAPAQVVPLGIRQGQTFNVGNGATVPRNFSAGRGSVVNVQTGGTIGMNLEAVASTVNIHGGSVGSRLDAYRGSTINVMGGTVADNLDAFPGSVVNISDGNVGNFLTAHEGSVVSISGGTVGPFMNANDGSLVNITGGSVGSFLDVNGGSVVNVSGGSVGAFVNVYEEGVFNVSGGSIGGNLTARNQSEVNISGGTFGSEFTAQSGSKIHLIGAEFFLNGAPLTVTPSPTLLTTRNATLSGLLLDGSAFSFDLNSTDIPQQDFFHTNALVTLSLGYAAADFDQDGDVDGTDLATWQVAYGVNANADTDGDDDSDGRDFLVWQRQYTGPASLQALGLAVPEPSCTILALFFAAANSRRMRAIVAK